VSVLMGSHAQTQERELRGYRWLWTGIQAAAIAHPLLLSAATIIGQEQPSQPSSVLGAGVQGPNVAAPPLPGHLIVWQEQPPDHPTLAASTAFPAPPGAILQGTSFIGTQEAPRPAATVSASGVQGPNVEPPSLARAILVSQEQPDFPPGLSRTRPGNFGPNVAAPPQVGAAIVRQEQPGHPPSFLLSFRATPSTFVTPELRWVVVRQEQPDHSGSRLGAGVQGPNVAANPQVGAVVVRQEQPSHPGSIFWSLSISVGAVAPGQRTLVVRQEQPWHPTSMLWNLLPTLFVPLTVNPEYVVGYSNVPKRVLGYPNIPIRNIPTSVS
jgi:hypothetical protein